MNWCLNHIKPGSLTVVTLSKTLKKYCGACDVYLLEAEMNGLLEKIAFGGKGRKAMIVLGKGCLKNGSDFFVFSLEMSWFLFSKEAFNLIMKLLWQ